jgi:hypothetical protein
MMRDADTVDGEIKHARGYFHVQKTFRKKAFASHDLQNPVTGIRNLQPPNSGSGEDPTASANT